MALVPVDLPTPTTMRGRWAAFAAILGARGWGSGAFAEPGRWHYDDGGGNWADLHLLDDGRAVLVGTALSPAQIYRKPDGTVVHTLWGELAYQLLGARGYGIHVEQRAIGIEHHRPTRTHQKLHGPERYPLVRSITQNALPTFATRAIVEKLTHRTKTALVT